MGIDNEDDDELSIDDDDGLDVDELEASFCAAIFARCRGDSFAFDALDALSTSSLFDDNESDDDVSDHDLSVAASGSLIGRLSLASECQSHCMASRGQHIRTSLKQLVSTALLPLQSAHPYS